MHSKAPVVVVVVVVAVVVFSIMCIRMQEAFSIWINIFTKAKAKERERERERWIETDDEKVKLEDGRVQHVEMLLQRVHPPPHPQVGRNLLEQLN